MTDPWLAPVTLEGHAVRLRPMTEADAGPLAEVGLDPAIWRHMTACVETLEQMRGWIGTALEWQRAGTALPFVLEEAGTGRVVGSSRYANAERTHRRVEIGWTWLAPPWQRTAINTEAKLLLLRHAFEAMGCLRVELKTDALNERSRAAIARIGATQEGVLRHHMVVADGRLRDTVMFSILADEWPAVRERLESRLARA